METNTVPVGVVKRIRLVDSRTGKEWRAQITEGGTVADMLRSAGLVVGDYQVHKPDGTLYQGTESPWKDVENEGKFHVMPKSGVGR